MRELPLKSRVKVHRHPSLSFLNGRIGRVLDYVAKSDAYYVDFTDKSGLDVDGLFVVTDERGRPLVSRKSMYPVDKAGNITA